MNIQRFVAVIVCFGFVNASQYYTDQWAVQIDAGPDVAKELAELHGFEYICQIMAGVYQFRHRKVVKRSLSPSDDYHKQLALEPKVIWLEQQISKIRVKRDAYTTMFNDPMWPQMWYMHRDNGLDMNVAIVYKKFNVTGRGVRVSILDDGIEKDHPDLFKNYDSGASYDINGHDNDPQPRYDFTNENRHGTRCAGEVAAEANNGICSVGIAYDANIGGVRMLDGDVTDAVEAQSISLNPQHIDIYSASWGPDDDGRTVDGPGPLARKAFFDGITQGRRGLGSIYVWASGNGGRNGDSCACDGYTNSIYTMSISSSSENGRVPWYSEACASTLATTYSSGAQGERQILTTDLRKKCTDTHTGTSASAPLAAGISALALQANPQLTWRDLQHIVVYTSKESNLIADDWVINGIGKKVSHHYGFGLMDSAAIVELAMRWKTVPDQHHCQMTSADINKNILSMSEDVFTIESVRCHGDEINYLEHVQAVVTLSTQRRGEVELYLTSPSGTQSKLLGRRSGDSAGDGFNNWAIMTTHCWGESSDGIWTLRVKNFATTSTLVMWSLVMYGTETIPSEYLTSPSTTLSNKINILDSSNNSFTSNNTIETINSRKVKETDDEFEGRVNCKSGQFLLNESCYTQCPPEFFASSGSDSEAMNKTPGTSEERLSSGRCIRCHESCVRCSGPDSNDCLECKVSQKLKSSSGGTFCQQDNDWFSILRIGLLALITCLLILPLIICSIVQIRNRRLKRRFHGDNIGNEVLFISRNRNHDNGRHAAIEVRSIDKPLLQVSSSESDEETIDDEMMEEKQRSVNH